MGTPNIESKFPAGIARTSDYKDPTKIQNEEMGQREFLLLFTTQLQNQSPLDPMDNEAFVAQLAQFSQLEATVSMSDSMKGLVDTIKSDRMLQGASLIGKKVASPNGMATLEDGKAISGVISIPKGADNIELAVYDSQGRKIHEAKTGRQPPGDITVKWDGRNSDGEMMPDGEYRFVAKVSSLGQNTQVPIATPTIIRSVTYSPEDGELLLEVSNGSTVRLSEVRRIEG